MIALALGVLCAAEIAGRTGQGDGWARVWTELERLRGGEVTGAEAELARARLGEVAAAGPLDARVELLRAELEGLAGRDASGAARRLAALEPSPFSPRELWFVADLLPPGPGRARVALDALAASPDPARWQVILAWNVAVDEARALRLETTLAIRKALDDRARAAWSAVDLASTYRLLGDREAMERTFHTGIAREEAAGRPTWELWSELGLGVVGFGDDARGRDYLGKALALGSDDAGLMLARMDLMAGRTEAARRGFRALILDQPPPDWAWRGWGTTLLPPALAAPARMPTDPIERR